MTTYETILKRRTIRLFKKKKISKKILEKLVNAGRLAPSARNLQPLEYLVVDDPILTDKVFENVYFGGKIEKLRTRENRPVAYILVLVNKKIRSQDFEYDVGLAAENIVLAAFEKGIGSCIIKVFQSQNLEEKIFSLPKHCFLDLVIALGYPAEKPVIEEKRENYWRDENNVLHVPKRPLKEILYWNQYGKFKKENW